MMSLTDTQRAILTAAAQHPERLAFPPERLPGGARQKVAKALLRQSLVATQQRPADDASALWMVEGESVLLKITDHGLRAIGVEPAAPASEDEQPAAQTTAQDAPAAPLGGQEPAPQGEGASEPEPAQAAPTPAPRAGLRDAATAVLAAWDDEGSREADIIGALEGPMAALRALLAGKPARATREPSAPRKPREGTKQEQVLAMLRRPDGATIAQIMETTGWQQHTVRGFFAGLKKRQGIEVQVLERVRQVGPNKEGAKGSFTIYYLPA
jgi:hypothetical protein